MTHNTDRGPGLPSRCKALFSPQTIGSLIAVCQVGAVVARATRNLKVHGSNPEQSSSYFPDALVSFLLSVTLWSPLFGPFVAPQSHLGRPPTEDLQVTPVPPNFHARLLFVTMVRW